jgi:carbonic anhydrase
MQKLIHGIHRFQNHVFSTKRELFGRLAHGQKPAALFLTCSDSRVNPNLLTQTDPGELFILRNAGNIVPPAPGAGGEIATLEFAICALGIENVIVCGHSHCGAVKGLIDPAATEEMPAVRHWLGHAQRTADIIRDEYDHLSGTERLMAAIEENVIVQIENLRTHALIEERLASGRLKLHGWMYKFETGRVFSYDPESGQFLPFNTSNEARPVYPRPEALA